VIQAIISGYTTERDIIDAPLVQEPERAARFERLRKVFRRNRDAEPDEDGANAG
jgi:hypothetical protein